MRREQLITAILIRAPRGEVTAPVTLQSIPPAAPPSEEAQPVPSPSTPSSVSSPAEVRQFIGESTGQPTPDSMASSPSPAPVIASVPAPSLPAPTVLSPSLPTPEVGRSADPSPEAAILAVRSWVSFMPRDPQWATVCWGISQEDQAHAQAAGGQQLALRITDVTDSQVRDGRPHTLQEVLVEATAHEWHLPVPLGNRDYRVELGYRTSGGGWVSLAFSTVVRMPADDDFIRPSFVPFVLADEIEHSTSPSLQHAPGLHERLYQQASAGRRIISQGSEGFHEQGGFAHGQESAGGQLSGVGLWASGREASGAGMAARQRRFWLVADAELIVYGATDPAATLTVADEAMPLSSDGTFSLHMPFPDGDQIYPIRALAADGEQQRSITLDFCRSTPHAKVNTKETAVPEWF